MTVINRPEWDEFLLSHPEAHLLQTGEWGDFKSQHGWSANFILSNQSGAQVLFRQLPLGFTVGYIPKGPVGTDWSSVVQQAIELCRERNAIVLYVEPDRLETDKKNQELLDAGLSASQFSIQPRRSIVIPLSGSEIEWMRGMKQKTRYNIRLAQKNEVMVEQSDEVDVFNQLIQQTGTRGEFGVHEPDYYRSVYERFSVVGKCCLLIARYAGQPLAGVMVFRHGNRAWYFYGASNEVERQRMPAYLLQWEAMRWASQQGCTEYDLWGVPDESYETLEENFAHRSDGLWGVYRFKRGFGGELIRSAGIYQKVLNHPLHWVFQQGMRIRKGAFS